MLFWCCIHCKEVSPEDDQPHPIGSRSEEHTSELQSQSNLVCRLLLEKKKIAELYHLYHLFVSARLLPITYSTLTLAEPTRPLLLLHQPSALHIYTSDAAAWTYVRYR